MAAKPLRLIIGVVSVVVLLATTAWSLYATRGSGPLPLDQSRQNEERNRAELDSLAGELSTQGAIVCRDKYDHIVTLTKDWRCSTSSLANIRRLQLVSVAYPGHCVVLEIAGGVDEGMILDLQLPANTSRIVVAGNEITDAGIARLRAIAPTGCVVWVRRDGEHVPKLQQPLVGT